MFYKKLQKLTVNLSWAHPSQPSAHAGLHRPTKTSRLFQALDNIQTGRVQHHSRSNIKNWSSPENYNCVARWRWSDHVRKSIPVHVTSGFGSGESKQFKIWRKGLSLNNLQKERNVSTTKLNLVLTKNTVSIG